VGSRSLVLLLGGALLTSGCVAPGDDPVPPATEPIAADGSVLSAALPQRPEAAGLEPRRPAQLVHSVDTDDKVVFLTIDDGLHEDPELLAYLAAERIPITAFLTTSTIVNWPFWEGLQPVGSIQNHTATHVSLPTLPNPDVEICAANEAIVEETGQLPWMVRPPYGAYNATTLAAAGRCGLDWVVHWSVSLPGKKLEYQRANGSLEPGDIILTHFRKGLVPALRKSIKDIRKQGFEVARLEDYLRPRGWDGKQIAEGLPDVAMATQTESRAVLVPET